jgi:hypothetical protein
MSKDQELSIQRGFYCPKGALAQLDKKFFDVHHTGMNDVSETDIYLPPKLINL